jgi:hypothetical protein
MIIFLLQNTTLSAHHSTIHKTGARVILPVAIATAANRYPIKGVATILIVTRRLA